MMAHAVDSHRVHEWLEFPGEEFREFPFIPGYAMSVGKEGEQSPCFVHVAVAPIVG
jgi:hypothetical protein